MTAPDLTSLSEKQLKSDLKLLTSARFFAALAVVFYHYFDLSLGPQHAVLPDTVNSSDRPIRSFFQHFITPLHDGNLAVEFFFILSGFVLVHVYQSRYDAGEFCYGSFIRRRIARIYPLHLLMLLTYLSIGVVLSYVGVESSLFEYRTIPNHLLMIHAWGVQDTGTFNNVSWSISAEWGAYLAFPLLLWAISKITTQWAIALSLLWFLLMFELFPRGEMPFTNRTYDLGLLRIAATFPMGMAAWKLFRDWVDSPRLTIVAYSAVAIGVASSIFCSAANLSPSWVVLGFPATIFGLACLDQANIWQQFCGHKLVYLGEISYGLYMIHMFVFRVPHLIAERVPSAFNATQYDCVMLTSIFISIILSHWSYKYFETPTRKWLTARKRMASVALNELQGEEL